MKTDTEFSQDIYNSGKYLSDTKNWHLEDSPFKSKQILKCIDKNKVEINSVCDIGCGFGGILRILNKKIGLDTKFEGFDISKKAVEFSKKFEAVNLSFSDMESFYNNGKKYDLLLALDVFEHIEDYMGFLRKIRARSKKHIFHVPLDMNALNIIRKHPIIHARETVGHLHYFSEETTLATFESCGYQVLDYFITPSFTSSPNKAFRSQFFNIFRKSLFNLNNRIAANLLNGFSMLVLTK